MPSGATTRVPGFFPGQSRERRSPPVARWSCFSCWADRVPGMTMKPFAAHRRTACALAPPRVLLADIAAFEHRDG